MTVTHEWIGGKLYEVLDGCFAIHDLLGERRAREGINFEPRQLPPVRTELPTAFSPEYQQIIDKVFNKAITKWMYLFDREDLRQDLNEEALRCINNYQDKQTEKLAKIMHKSLPPTTVIPESYLYTCLWHHVLDLKDIEFKRYLNDTTFNESFDHISPVHNHILKGDILKTALCAYLIAPNILTIETRDYVSRIFPQLTLTEAQCIVTYAYGTGAIPSNVRKCMERILEKFEESEG